MPKGSQRHRAALPDDGCPTRTSVEQEKQEQQMDRIYAAAASEACGPTLAYEAHVDFCVSGLEALPSHMVYLDCSRPWLCYWILHALELMGWNVHEREQEADFQQRFKLRSHHIVDWMARCFHEEVGEDGLPYGGYGGGPGQLAHLAPTYAAVCALCIVGTEEAYSSIPRDKILRWMLRLKTDDNAFRMHEDGELDIRAIYTCLAVALLLDILNRELTQGVADYLLRCQTWEGGLGCEPYDEAHGGYTFCGLAALVILKAAHRLNLPQLFRWICARQKRLEGGFDGRTNKLVDSCYSFWVGATYPLAMAAMASSKPNPDQEDLAVLEYVHLLGTEDVERQLAAERDSVGPKWAMPDGGDWFFDEVALQEYLLLCCQHPQGGLKDKPEKAPDYYHTCYALSGLAIAQHGAMRGQRSAALLGGPGAQLQRNSPLINITEARVRAALRHFGGRTHI